MELFNLTDEEVWLKYMIAIADDRLSVFPEDVKIDATCADIFLQEFKNRFRDGV